MRSREPDKDEESRDRQSSRVASQSSAGSLYKFHEHFPRDSAPNEACLETQTGAALRDNRTPGCAAVSSGDRPCPARASYSRCGAVDQYENIQSTRTSLKAKTMRSARASLKVESWGQFWCAPYMARGWSTGRRRWPRIQVAATCARRPHPETVVAFFQLLALIVDL